MYWGVIDPEWRTLDVLENTERTIHDVVRINQKGATPPYLHATRVAPDQVTIVYTSPRRLCSVAKGITRGIARHYDESVSIEDPRCMLRGDDDCLHREEDSGASGRAGNAHLPPRREGWRGPTRPCRRAAGAVRSIRAATRSPPGRPRTGACYIQRW